MGSVKLGAGAVLQNSDDEVLLVKEGVGEAKAKWNIPSGGYDGNETLSETAEREVYEETGVRIRTDGVIGIYPRPPEPNGDLELFLVIFAASRVGGELRPQNQDEILEATYVPERQLDSLDLRLDVGTVVNDYNEHGSVNIPIKNIAPEDW